MALAAPLTEDTGDGPGSLLIIYPRHRRTAAPPPRHRRSELADAKA